FAEYVDGGSLATWIRERRLTTLGQILDVAIQFAWGLAAAHDAGLVHQDVKPGNALMTPAGVVKIADFGLARARAEAGEAAERAEQSLIVSWGGMTLGFCSPEQAAGERLTRRTDIWSWAVSVLEMFIGKVDWSTGPEAPRALQRYLEKTPPESGLPPMPAAVADVLHKCFREDPAERWSSMTEVADALRLIY